MRMTVMVIPEMLRARRALSLVVVGAAAALACAASPALAHPGARPGEAFTFKFSVGPIESGRARLSVGQPVVRRDGRRLIAAHGQAETAKWLQLIVKLDDDYKLVYDAGTILPETVESIERGVRERRIAARFDGRHVEVEIVAKRDGGKERHTLPELARDPMSAFFALRAATLRDGDRLGFDVLDGAALWRARVSVHGRERVRLDADGEDAKSRAAVRLDGDLRRIDDAGHELAMAGRTVRVWLSDDAERLLLKVEGDTDLGRASLEMTSWTPPTTRRPRHETAPPLPGITVATESAAAATTPPEPSLPPLPRNSSNVPLVQPPDVRR
jgi:hypothetical protein